MNFDERKNEWMVEHFFDYPTQKARLTAYREAVAPYKEHIENLEPQLVQAFADIDKYRGLLGLAA